MQTETFTRTCSGIRARMLMVMSALLIAACGTEVPSEEGSEKAEVAPSAVSVRAQGVGSTNKVLILANTVTGGTSSLRPAEPDNVPVARFVS